MIKIDVVKKSPNHSGKRKYGITRITPHHAAGVLSLESLLTIFVPTSRKASCNYAIGSDGRIGLCVDEENRAWTSSSSDNDNRAITVEIANSTGAPNWKISAKAEQAFVDLCVDVCKRYGKKGVFYEGKLVADREGWLQITLHKWFKATNCPGPYLEKRIPDLVKRINEKLNTSEPKKELYRVQVGAYSVEANAKAMAEKLKKAGFDTYIVKY